MVCRDTLLDFFNDVAIGRVEFLVYDDGFRARSYTYADCADAARGFAARLQGAGLRKGDKVVFWSENRPEWIIALWGCLLNGSIAVPIDYRASKDFLSTVVRIVDAKLILLGEDVELAGPDVVPAFKPATWKLSDIDWRMLDASTFTPVDITRDDTVEIIFTSGATAEPKGVVLTHRNVLANIVPVEREVLKYKKYGRPFFPIRFLNLLPLSHMFGQAMATFVPPMLGGTVVFMRGFNPHEIVRQVKKRRVSVLVSVPKILDVLADHVARLYPEVREIPHQKAGVVKRWWRYRAIHRLFGLKFWSFVVGAAPLESSLESFWGKLGFLVIQGYGLTETAPIVTLNHPFSTSKGSVGKAIAGVDIKIAPDGEILVRGDNVTQGYYGAPEGTGAAFEGGWFHTGDVGELDAQGRLFIRGRKKEMIVTPEGLNVFPEDVERVVNAVPGVRDSGAVGVTQDGEERVQVALIVEPGTNAGDVVKAANAVLADHQRIRAAHIWPGAELPRTEGTRKLKRHEIRAWLQNGAAPVTTSPAAGSLASVVARFAGGRPLEPGMTLEELGLSSLERIEMMVALEGALNTTIDEAAFSNATTVADLERLASAPGPASGEFSSEPPLAFPSWNRTWPIRAMRAVSQSLFLLPLTRVFAWIKVEGLQNLQHVQGPVIFAANHQSHMDGPVILAALPGHWRRRVATAMAKEFFKPHFFPEQHTRKQWFTNSLNYWLSAAFFNTFPLPQREVGARQTLRYAGELIGEGFSILIFPEGKRTDRGEIAVFRPGVAMMASRLDVPVIPVRLEGIDRVLHKKWKMAKPGRVTVSFGAPIRLSGDNYVDLASQVETAVRKLGG
ncbi:MAG TPA: AMP-binding protein [Vicinamibacterales bacterium]|nr:AMP-binding protein [Vicinamibacterales bacterium]